MDPNTYNAKFDYLNVLMRFAYQEQTLSSAQDILLNHVFTNKVIW